MGYSDYSVTNRMSSERAKTYTDRSVKTEQIFTQKTTHADMSPFGVKFREARDSVEHPNTIPIIFALDETGSMQSLPRLIIAEGLPTIMGTLIQAGLKDATLLFMGIGDHVYDQSPLQVGQFESGDVELDKWLTSVRLEKGGGPNDGESYFLAHYFAAYHTSIDSFEKRGKKGFLFTVGDEKTLDSISAHSLKALIGDAYQSEHRLTARECLVAAQEKYHVFHFHMMETLNGRQPGVLQHWKNLLGQNVIVVDHHEDIPRLMIEAILSVESREAEVKIEPAFHERLKSEQTAGNSEPEEEIL